MSIKLHRCPNTWAKLGGHPCWKVQRALDEQGIEYMVVPGPLTTPGPGADPFLNAPNAVPGDAYGANGPQPYRLNCWIHRYDVGWLPQEKASRGLGGFAVFETPLALGPRHCPQNLSSVVCAVSATNGATESPTNRLSGPLTSVSFARPASARG